MISFDLDYEIPVMEHFHTLQGEGFHAGRAAYFIRLAGCNVGCHWCDVKESWDAQKEQIMPISALAKAVADSKVDFVVITGGEPAMYDLHALTSALKKINCTIAIETSGCYPVKGTIDWFCFSPKKFKSPIDDSYKKADELKIIINHPSDFSWAQEHAEKVNEDCQLYLQAEWSKKEKYNALIVDHIKGNKRWKISLQTHKFLNIP